MQPSRRVRITRPFYLGAHEVTRGQFRRFVDDSGYQTDAEKGDRKGIRVIEFAEGETKVAQDPEDLASIGNVADAAAKGRFPDWKWTIRGSDGYAYTAPVGTFRANKLGLYDMHGNVFEWCSDWWDAAYWKNSPSEDPAGPATGSERVLRGGGWCHHLWSCCSADRNVRYQPAFGYNIIGFRVALVPVESGRVDRTKRSYVPDR